MHIPLPNFCLVVKVILGFDELIATWNYSTAFPIPRVNEDIILSEYDEKYRYRVNSVVYELQENEIRVFVGQLI